MTLCPQTNHQAIHARPAIGRASVLAGLGGKHRSCSIDIEQTWVIDEQSPDPLGAIEQIIHGHQQTDSDSDSDAGWLMMLSYEFGAVIEPKAVHDSKIEPTYLDTREDFPFAVLQRWRANSSGKRDISPTDAHYTIGPIRSSMGRKAYIDAVERTKAYIGAGDIYQANIAHHLRASFSGSLGGCFADLTRSADPRFGAMMIFEHRGVRHGVGSISPELFLGYDPKTRTLSTEPMKGTRPGGGDHAELRDSVKDRAELDMITDLMRNDLGRICSLGSVRVKDPRSIESHQSGVIQASSRIEGQLRSGVGLGEIIRAAFPPGSVTGAPKVRAMQIINELERCPRGPYCGSMLLLDDSGAIHASVLIRTAHIWGEIDPEVSDGIINGRFSYPVGAGVVADSDSASEWAETLVKAAVLKSAMGADFNALG